MRSDDAARLLIASGPNEVPDQQERWAKRLASKFWAPVPWMLEATALLELVLGRWADASLVVAVLVLNALIGIVQEGRARDALALLRSRLQVMARVLRDGAWSSVPAANLVPGDVVHVRLGDFVPADLEVLDGEVLADQSSLTGESAPVEGTPGSNLYSGTVIVRGEATARVLKTGTGTYFGRTAQLVGSSAPKEHLGGLVLRMVRVFIAMDLVIAVAGTTYLAWAGAGVDTVLSLAVVLLLASVPVALPAAFALAGALGARRLARDGILTTRLSVLQDAASMEVLCVDKTGTLTLNHLTVTGVVGTGGTDPGETLKFAAAASDAATQDPIDLAILAKPGSAGEPGWKRTSFVPFDPATKRSQASWTDAAGTHFEVTKGAPAAVTALTGLDLSEALTQIAAEGARVLAVAIRKEGSPWSHCGLVGLADAPRPEAALMLKELGQLGIRTIMITGDSAQTAAAIARKLGMEGSVIVPGQLDITATDLAGVTAVAQVLPEHKHQLVKGLQRAGTIVGMTGDGVNDAPALRQAEVGIAVEGATDVAKAAAGAVLARGGLEDIVALVEESRRIHQRSLTYALNASVKKIEVPLLLALGVFAWKEFVFTPLLMALLLLANAVVSMATTSDRARPSARPDIWQAGKIITGGVVVAIPMLAASAAVLVLAQGPWLHAGTDELRTVVFLTLVFSSQVTIYIVRTGARAWTDPPSKWLLAATAHAVLAAAGLALTGTLMHPVPPPVVAGVAATILGAAHSSPASCRPWR
ncbi:HAD-IC family P-type ATPase [Arthrobacter sp. NQ7]|uniref:HAD-IC family P-type ATPase n=1 Tax=Arthrobacter sp. NQ7 TaxID=3032303 RepID=UPI00240F4429|nr:HAD-IC family P-type ATPase [Arthrobacter sp. NQ7]MDJ0459673.1 HAD-IC family P-type ATPase [Arthrobacter sp. NQ7]